jgi:hypothetical protein
MKNSKYLMILILAFFSIMLSLLYSSINNIQLLFVVSLTLIITTNIFFKIRQFITFTAFNITSVILYTSNNRLF